ncbi:MAG: hypothetical protein ACKO2K_01570 [Alphaproteobacteria bacterium]
MMRSFVDRLAGAGLVAAAVGAASVGATWPSRALAADGLSVAIEPPSPEYEAERAKRDALAAKAAPKKVAASPGDRLADLQRTFAEFCTGWADKLRQRQRDNLAQAKWQTSADGSVFAEYVGYDTDHLGPQTISHPETTPIGKMVYVEQRLQRSGRSKDEALAAQPAVVEQTEVTEIFRHDGRGWVY